VSSIGQLTFGLLLTAVCVYTPTATAAGTGADGAACAVAFRPYPATGGFTADLTVRNTGTVPINGWTLRFPLDDGAKVSHFWEAELLSPSGPVVAQNKPYNGLVPAGGAIGLGFKASGPLPQGLPRFTVNGIICAVG
jgi:endoglucanase